MPVQEGEPSLTDIQRQLSDLAFDVRELRNSFVSSKSWEEWRRENYAPRVERLEATADRLDARIDEVVERINNRFRSNTMSAMTTVAYPLVVALILYIANKGAL